MSSASNKEFESGEIIELLHCDTDCLESLVDYISTVIELPIQCLYTLGVCLYYFSWTLYASGLVILAMIVVEYGVNFITRKIEESSSDFNSNFRNK